MASQTPLAHTLPPSVRSEKVGVLIDWVLRAEASSPSTWDTSPKRSRRAQGANNIHSPIKRQKKRRRPLEQTTGNTMSRRDNVMVHRDSVTLAGKAQDNRRRSPRKGPPSKRAQDSTNYPSTLYENNADPSGQELESRDRERTPRPRSSRAPDLSDTLIVPPPTYNQNAADMDRSESETLHSRESGSRSSSPVEKFADLSMADIPTEYQELDGHVSARLKGVLTKYGRLREVAAGVGVIPSSLKLLMEKNYHEDDRPLPHAYTSSCSENSNVATRDYAKRLGDQAIEIRNAARDCDKMRGQEDDWNTEVQIPLLKLVLSNPKYGGAVQHASVKTARIAPAALSRKHSSGASMQSKKVDFAILIEPSDVLSMKIHNLLKPLAVQQQSINQTMMSSIRKRPIAFSIETKPPFCGDKTSDVQLSIWVGAGIERLRWMMKEKSRMPPFPALSMHGHDLYLVVYEEQETKNIMYGKMRLGGTDTITGFFQIIAAVDVLVEWAHTDYRKWFESIICQENNGRSLPSNMGE